jgi:RNA polymerase sigma factor (TIGR02999 family)
VGELTALLERVAAGDGDAREPLYKLLYPELMRLARSHLARAGTVSLDTTAVIHEAYIRLAEVERLPNTNRHVFLAYASKVMHSVVVDYVRERHAQKRGGDATFVTISSASDSLFAEHPIQDIEDAMRALESVDQRSFRVVEMRYFGGMTEDEIGSVLDISSATVRRDWRKARAFLYEQLS